MIDALARSSGQDRKGRLTRLMGDDLETELRSLAQDSVGLVQGKKSVATLRAYRGQFDRFAVWCQARQFPFLPTEEQAVVAYIAWMGSQGLKLPTILQTLAAITHEHAENGEPWDSKSRLLLNAIKGARRAYGVRPRQVAPVLEDDLRKMCEACPASLLGLRDRAIILLGWWGAFRRSEIVGLDVADIEFVEQGLLILLSRSKTDKHGKGIEKGLWKSEDHPEVRPQLALRAWLDASGIQEGPVFRVVWQGPRRWGARKGQVLGERLTGKAVARLVKARALGAGLDPTRFSGHSLRAGFVTTAAAHDRPLDEIMRQTGHASEKTVLEYIRHASVFSKNATKGLLKGGG